MPASALRDAHHMVRAMDDICLRPMPPRCPRSSYIRSRRSTAEPIRHRHGSVVALKPSSPNPFAWLQAATTALAAQIGASGRAAPTHLAVGAAVPMDLPAGAGNAIRTQAEVRATVFQMPLHAGVPAPAHPQTLRAEIRLFRPGDWLLGGAALGDTRVRDLALRLDLPNGAAVCRSKTRGRLAWSRQPIVTASIPPPRRSAK
jgi:hypothetical protein